MDAVLAAAVSILFHGLAYAMILYIISVGLSVTMGLMGFVNLAHGVFAMAGGYVTVTLMNDYGVPFGLALLAAFISIALISVILERGLYARLYGGSELEQVLFTIGLIFMAVAVVRYVWGPLPQRMTLPPLLSGQIDLGFRTFPVYRTFLIGVSFVLILALWLGIERTNFGAQIRAAVDNRRMAESLGINTRRLFTLTFALGSGLAAFGGGLGADILAINPGYAIEYLVYFLIVVAVGGLGSLRGPFVAALLLGISDTACKYLIPELGAFFIFLAMIAILLWRPAGLFGGLSALFDWLPSSSSKTSPVERLVRSHRLRPIELLPWILAVAAYFAFDTYLPLGSQILIMILFALSVDLVMGYAGIVTLGHAAFFGVGAYTAGIYAVHVTGEPLSGLVLAAIAAAAVGFVSGLVILRTHGLTLLMLTLAVASLLGEAANKASFITGGADGLQGMSIDPVLGLFRFDLFGKTAYLYCLAALFLMWIFARRLVHSPFGRTLTGIRENVTRMHAIGSPVRRRLLTIYTISAGLAGVAGALLAQTTQFVGLTVLSFERSGEIVIMLVFGGIGRLYGAFVGATFYMIAQDQLAKADPIFWSFWIGALLVLVVMFARGGILGLIDQGMRYIKRRK